MTVLFVHSGAGQLSWMAPSDGIITQAMLNNAAFQEASLSVQKEFDPGAISGDQVIDSTILATSGVNFSAEVNYKLLKGEVVFSTCDSASQNVLVFQEAAQLTGSAS